MPSIHHHHFHLYYYYYYYYYYHYYHHHLPSRLTLRCVTSTSARAAGGALRIDSVTSRGEGRKEVRARPRMTWKRGGGGGGGGGGVRGARLDADSRDYANGDIK